MAGRITLKPQAVSTRRYYGDEEDRHMTDRDRVAKPLFKLPMTYEEKQQFGTASLAAVLKELEDAAGPQTGLVLTTAEKVRMSATLGTTTRNGTLDIPGNFDPPQQQGMVILTVELPNEGSTEYQQRRGVAQPDRLGALGPEGAMTVHEGVLLFTRAKSARTAPAGMPDISAWSHFGGLDSRECIQFVGVSQVMRSNKKGEDSALAASISGTPWCFNTSMNRIPALTRLAVDPNPIVTIDEDGPRPYFQVAGHHPMTLYPSLRSFDDVDAAQMAAKVDCHIQALEEELIRKHPGAVPEKEWFEETDSMFRNNLFNDDSYDPDRKLPIQNYADWAAIHARLTLGVADTKVVAARIEKLMRDELMSPNFRKFCDEFGDDLDTSKDDEIAAIVRTKDNWDKHDVRKLQYFVHNKMLSCIGAQHSWEGRLLVARTLNTTVPGVAIDLLV